jgi:hypothetical protein
MPSLRGTGVEQPAGVPTQGVAASLYGNSILNIMDQQRRIPR